MSSERRFEQDLPGLLDDLYMGPMPAYRDHVLHQTARTNQRPAWSFLGRWLPMVDIARQPVLAPRLRWPAIGLVLVLLALLVAMVAALAVGGRPRPTPPFGVARSGLVAYASGGDIYTGDPVSGLAHAVVTGPETDVKPVWSLDGTHFVFERMVSDVAGPGRLFVARADGSDVVAIIPEPQAYLAGYTFSPDGSEVAFTSGPATDSALWIAKADGTNTRRVDVGMSVQGPSYRPPNGAEIIFVGGSATGAGTGIYAVDVATGKVRTIVEPSSGVGLDRLTVAPDGSRIAYSASTADPSRNTYSVHVSAIDGPGTVTLPMPAGATFQDAPAWSNDGTRLVVVRGYATRNQDIALAVLPADGSGVGIETRRGLTGCCDTVYAWAPDDKSVLMSPEDLTGQTTGQLLLDPASGASRPAPWAATGDPAWQRVAP